MPGDEYVQFYFVPGGSGQKCWSAVGFLFASSSLPSRICSPTCQKATPDFWHQGDNAWAAPNNACGGVRVIAYSSRLFYSTYERRNGRNDKTSVNPDKSLTTIHEWIKGHGADSGRRFAWAL